MIKIFKLFSFISILFFCGGCNYKAGLTPERNPCRLGVIIKNNSKAIQFTSVFRRIFKEELLKYPDLSLVDPASPNKDFTISLVFESYGLSPESFQALDTISADSFQGKLSVHTSLQNCRYNREFFNEDYLVSASTPRILNPGHVGDRQLKITIARDLSQRIARDLIQALP